MYIKTNKNYVIFMLIGIILFYFLIEGYPLPGFKCKFKLSIYLKL